MQYLHTMVRVADLSASLRFYCDGLGLNEIRRYDSNQGRFTLVFLAAPNDIALAQETRAPLIELTYNWDPEEYTGGRNFGHLAYRVEDIYALCSHLQGLDPAGVNRVHKYLRPGMRDGQNSGHRCIPLGPSYRSAR